MTSWAATCRVVRDRAKGRCEYCRMHQSLQGATFHVEHVRPSAAGGSDDPANLALACPRCNLHKSDRRVLPDPDSLSQVPIFNPRTDTWADHFAWNGYRLIGLTPTGRAMIEAFHSNDPRLLLIREAEEHFDLFPPT